MVNRWARDNSRASQCINARSETLEQRPTFREAFQQRRCVVPADGLFEWSGPKGKRQPLLIHPRAGVLLLFAGLYESWYPEKDRPELTFTIVTCAANSAIASIHDRMPVVLDERSAPKTFPILHLLFGAVSFCPRPQRELREACCVQVRKHPPALRPGLSRDRAP